MRKIIVGSRESKLAMIQTKWVIDELKRLGIKNDIEIRKMSTKGDRKLDVSLSEVGGSGIFIQDIEAALRQKEIDFAVHSMKDLPPVITDEFVIAAVPKREDHRDAYIAKDHVKLADLPAGAVIGTSSARRAAQMLSLRPDLKMKWIRGAVDSRLKQLEEGAYDAIILAVAGLNRLGLSDETITEYLPADTFVPAVGQGALAIECRKDDVEMRNILSKINDEQTELGVITERQFVYLLDDEDKAPIGAYAYVENQLIHLHASVASIDGQHVLTESVQGTDPKVIAQEAANKLLNQGARDMIEQAKRGE